MNQTVTLGLLKEILEAHTLAIVARFAGILQRNNEEMSDYVRDSIEAISALQIRQNHMQTMVERSLDGLSDGIVGEVSKILAAGNHEKE